MGIEHVAATPKAKQNFESQTRAEEFCNSRHVAALCSRTSRPRSAGRPLPQIPSRLLENWSQSVLSPQKEYSRKLVTSTPSPFHFSSSTNPRATAPGQKVLEGISLFPPSNDLWDVPIGAHLKSTNITVAISHNFSNSNPNYPLSHIDSSPALLTFTSARTDPSLSVSRISTGGSQLTADCGRSLADLTWEFLH